MTHVRVFVGYDEREQLSYHVTVRSILRHASVLPTISPITRKALGSAYTRPTEIRDGKNFDVISNLPSSTDFSIARFWVPYLCGYNGWALFVDGDFLFRDDIAKLFALADERYAVMVVKHSHERAEQRKMDDQVQKFYPRKLWSALMLFNCAHMSCRNLDLEVLNQSHRHDLHQFRWCKDDEIGALPMNWHVVDIEPAAYHFTLGTPEIGVWGSSRDEEWMSYLNPSERAQVQATHPAQEQS